MLSLISRLGGLAAPAIAAETLARAVAARENPNPMQRDHSVRVATNVSMIGCTWDLLGGGSIQHAQARQMSPLGPSTNDMRVAPRQ